MCGSWHSGFLTTLLIFYRRLGWSAEFLHVYIQSIFFSLYVFQSIFLLADIFFDSLCHCLNINDIVNEDWRGKGGLCKLYIYRCG